MGISLGRALVGIGTGGLSEAARYGAKKIGGSSALFGEGSKDVTPEDVRKTQEQGRTLQRSALTDLASIEKPTKESVQSQVETEKERVRTGAQDTIRRLRDLRASRGQVGTSLGLGQERSLIDRSNRGQQQLQASLPERLRQMQTQSALQRIQGAGSVLGQPGTTIMSQPTQGLAPTLGALAGGGLGAYFGGAQGAVAGSKLGSGVGSGLSGMFGGK